MAFPGAPAALPPLPQAVLETLLDRSGVLLYAVDGAERLVTLNRAMRDRIDYDPSDLPDLRSLLRALYPEPALREAIQLAHRGALAGERGRDAEWVLSTRPGDTRVVRWQLVLHGEGAGRVLVAVGEDVTDRRRLEHWVRLQNALLERVPDAVVVADMEGRIVHWAGGAEHHFGYSPRGAMERPLSNLLGGDNPRGRALDWIARARADGAFELTHELRREKGDTLECRVAAARVNDARGQMAALALVVSPLGFSLVTAPDDGPEAAAGTTELERALAQVSSVAIVVTKADGIVRCWSRAAERLGGTGSGRALGRKFLDEVMRVEDLSWDGLSTRLHARGRHSAAVVVKRPNGTTSAAQLDAVVVRSPAGSTEQVVAFLADRSELVALAEQSRATKERAIYGVFTEGVVRRLQDACAHFEPDVRGVLANVSDLRALGKLVASGASQRDFERFCRRALSAETDRELERVSAALGEGTYRLRTLVDDVNRFMSSEPDPPGPVRLSRELEAARDLVGFSLENRARLEIAVADLPPARASRGPLLRALCLLLLSAGSSLEATENAAIEIQGRASAGWLALEIRDNGAGFPADVQSRIGDLAYLAAQPGYAALFLGLAKEAIRLAGGTLELDSASGTGARVRVNFPAADAHLAVAPTDLRRPRPIAQTRVLLVEEDDLLRRAIERHVAEIHGVDAFSSVAEALAASEGARWDAAVISFPRPEPFGLRLFAKFAEAVPSLQRNTIAVVPSGLRHMARERLVQQGCILLARPLDLTTLRSLLERILPAEEMPVEAVE
jgi:PAS domain S-box-containing protein